MAYDQETKTIPLPLLLFHRKTFKHNKPLNQPNIEQSTFTDFKESKHLYEYFDN